LSVLLRLHSDVAGIVFEDEFSLFLLDCCLVQGEFLREKILLVTEFLADGTQGLQLSLEWLFPILLLKGVVHALEGLHLVDFFDQYMFALDVLFPEFGRVWC
jgi:hypothetical protein